MSYIEKFKNIKNMIGSTPLLEITLNYKGEMRKVYAKAEYFNITGSIKDRVAYYILENAYKTGKIKEGNIIAEATSGNTGIAFSALGSYLGHKVIIYMPDWMSKERINLIKSYGAEIRLVSKDEGGFLGSIAMTEKLAVNGDVFLPCQFSNEDNTHAHYFTTGEEISNQLKAIGLVADGVVAGVGTGGTVMGIARRLKEDNPKCKAFPLEPLNSPTLSTGYKTGAHRIQGISDEFIPPILKMEEMHSVVSVDDIDSIIMAKMLSNKFGIGVGISSGANILGCLKAQDMIGSDKVIVTVLADDNKKYLSTDYSEDWEVKAEYMTKDIELISVKSYK